MRHGTSEMVLRTWLAASIMTLLGFSAAIVLICTLDDGKEVTFLSQRQRPMLLWTGPRSNQARMMMYLSGKPSKAELRRQSLWLGEHWYVAGLMDNGTYMEPDDVYSDTGSGIYQNSIFDFGPNDGIAVNPDTQLPAPGMTTYWISGDGETKPGLFDIQGIRKNEDGDLASSWYEENEPQSNFMYPGSGTWSPNVPPEVEVNDGHVDFIDDGLPTHYGLMMGP